MIYRVIFILFITLSFFVKNSNGQQQFSDYKQLKDSLNLVPEKGIQIPTTERGYTLLLPKSNKKIKGLIIQFEGRKLTLENLPPDMKLHPEAFKQGLGVLYVSTGNPVDFYFDEKNMIIVDNLIQKAMKKHNLQTNNLFYVGMSLGGTQALKFTIFCKRHSSKCSTTPDSIAVIDAPLDMTRFWMAAERAEKIDFHRIGAGEGLWVSSYIERELGGTPRKNPEAYLNYSPYSFSAENTENIGGNAKYLTDIPVRAYHEPDADWWLKNRRKGYYSMNSIDMAGLINALKILGNENAQLVTTHNQRKNPDESPHTWSIVDKNELVKWFASTVN